MNAPARPAVAARPRYALAAAACLAALIALSLAWELWLAPLRPGGSALMLKAVPLALALPGVWRRNIYTMQWASMLILVYLAEKFGAFDVADVFEFGFGILERSAY